MTFMVWNDYLVTGIDIVDRQHRGLVDMLNQAAPVLAQASGDSLADAGPLLDALVNYAVVHFRTEEEIMDRLAMDARAVEHHRQSHQKFGEQVAAMARDYMAGNGVTGDRLLSFLASWLVLHIMGEDQAMARQVQALERGGEPDDAYVQARGGELSPAPAALSRAMVDIYSVLTRQNRELLLANQELDTSRVQIQQHNEHLEDQVRLRTAELQKLADDLRQARDAAEAGSRAKTRFLGTMSHELRTPMNAILGYSRLLRDQHLPSRQQDLAERIIGAADRLLELLNGIIDYARLEGGSDEPLAAAPFSLAALLREASEVPFAAARSKGLMTALEVDPALPSGFLADATQIQRILAIYLGNAVKFTQKGALRLQARHIGVDDDGRIGLRLMVSDTGVGIPQEAQARLFQPFSQADDSPDRHFEGIGLGLALARQLALRLGGQVGVHSQPDKGSHFWLELALPRADNPDEPTRPGPSPSVPTSPAAQPSAARSQPLPHDLRRELVRLDGLLATYDTQAASLLASLAPSLALSLGEQLAPLRTRVAAFEYDEARMLLRDLLGQVTEETHP